MSLRTEMAWEKRDRDRTGGTETHVVKERGGNEQNSKTERWNWHLRSPVQTDRAETREREREKKKKQRWATTEHLTGILFVNRACLHPIKPRHTDNIPARETLWLHTSFLTYSKGFDVARNVQFRSPPCMSDGSCQGTIWSVRYFLGQRSERGLNTREQQTYDKTSEITLV